jgi:nucleoside-diphosphate-sugar epimerase
MARVLIVGCGYVGVTLGLELMREGHDVWGLRRREAALPRGIVPVVADVGLAPSLAALPEDLDTVVYMVSPGGSDEALYRTAYVQGLSNVLDVLHRRPPRRFIFVSSTAVYAQEGGEWVDEGSATAPTDFSGRLLLEGEAVLREARSDGTVVRFGGIYGPRRTRLVERVRSGRAVSLKSPEQWTNRIHRDDCAGVLKHLMMLPAPDDLYLGVDCEPASEFAVLQWLAGVMGAPDPRQVSRRHPDLRLRTGNKRCRNDRLLASGYEFRHPTYREGYRTVLAGIV